MIFSIQICLFLIGLCYLVFTLLVISYLIILEINLMYFCRHYIILFVNTVYYHLMGFQMIYLYPYPITLFFIIKNLMTNLTYFQYL
jgi:hypothetical protein